MLPCLTRDAVAGPQLETHCCHDDPLVGAVAALEDAAARALFFESLPRVLRVSRPCHGCCSERMHMHPAFWMPYAKGSVAKPTNNRLDPVSTPQILLRKGLLATAPRQASRCAPMLTLRSGRVIAAVSRWVFMARQCRMRQVPRCSATWPLASETFLVPARPSLDRMTVMSTHLRGSMLVVSEWQRCNLIHPRCQSSP